MYYQAWNIFGHLIPSVFAGLRRPKDWRLYFAGFFASTVEWIRHYGELSDYTGTILRYGLEDREGVMFQQITFGIGCSTTTIHLDIILSGTHHGPLHLIQLHGLSFGA